jgi:dihydrofolate synthase/folylpolyglutamate synthase
MVNRTLPDDDDHVTQFEALTAAAYHELARRGVEVAVIEAGLGGRYDATNVIPSKVQVLTNVGLEHTRWLGPTVTDIAEEKLAVVRDQGTLVVGELDPDAEEVAERVVREHHARLVHAAGTGAGADVAAADPLPAGYQRANFSLAAVAAGAFLGRAPSPAALEGAAVETHVPGRLDVVAQNPLTVLDGAHNPAGVEALVAALPGLLGERRPRVCVISVLEDKDAAAMLRALLPAFDRVVLTHCANPRALSPATLETLARQLGGPPTETVPDPVAALEQARALAGPRGAVLATGSIYLIADLVRERGDARASTL